MQEALILQCTCNYSLVFPPGDTILGTSLPPPPPPPPPPLLLLLNHSQCASLSWPKMERERKLSVRDNISFPDYSLHQLIHNTRCTHVQQTTGFGNHYSRHHSSKHSMMTMTSMWQSRILSTTGLSLRAGFIHASEMFIHPWSRREPPL